MTKKQKDTLINSYLKKTDIQLKDSAIELVEKLENKNITDSELEEYQEHMEALKIVLDQKDLGEINHPNYIH